MYKAITKKLIAKTYEYVEHSVGTGFNRKQYTNYVNEHWDAHCEEVLQKYASIKKDLIIMDIPDPTEEQREEGHQRIMHEFAIEDLFRSKYFKV